MGNKQSSSKGGSKKVVNPSPTIDDATKRELQDKYGCMFFFFFFSQTFFFFFNFLIF